MKNYHLPLEQTLTKLNNLWHHKIIGIEALTQGKKNAYSQLAEDSLILKVIKGEDSFANFHKKVHHFYDSIGKRFLPKKDEEFDGLLEEDLKSLEKIRPLIRDYSPSFNTKRFRKLKISCDFLFGGVAGFMGYALTKFDLHDWYVPLAGVLIGVGVSYVLNNREINQALKSLKNTTQEADRLLSLCPKEVLDSIKHTEESA